MKKISVTAKKRLFAFFVVIMVLLSLGLMVNALLPSSHSNAHAATSTTASMTSKIVSIAKANLGKRACSINSAGGRGYYSSCTGNGGSPELWCSDFAHWVWAQAGANTYGLSPAAGSFGLYGPLKSTPQVGDAILFDYNGNGYADHVALVIQVNSNHTIVTIGGDEGSGSAGSTHVDKDGPYSDKLGYSSYMGQSISGYVAPRPKEGGIVAPPGGAAPKAGTKVPTGKWWITTLANAAGYYGGWTKVGTLRAGTSYVFCKKWGAEVKVGSSYNHYWLWTDLDVGGPKGWVSAYYLSKWGNDQAKDNSGRVIPNCY